MKEQSVEDLNFCIRDLNMIHKRLNKIIKHERYDSTDLVKDLSEYKDFIFIRLCGLNGIIIKYKALSEPAESPSVEIGVDSRLLPRQEEDMPPWKDYERISYKQVNFLKNQQIKFCKVSFEDFCNKFKVSCYEDLPSDRMDEALEFVGRKLNPGHPNTKGISFKPKGEDNVIL